MNMVQFLHLINMLKCRILHNLLEMKETLQILSYDIQIMKDSKFKPELQLGFYGLVL